MCVRMKINRKCGKCGNEGTLKTVIMQNGGVQIKYVCACGNRSNPIAKKEVEAAGIDISLLPVDANYAEIECEVQGCFNLGYEWHHIAPRHLFGSEAGLWPMIKLCKIHHKQWHDIVTPNMCEVK